jgi:hypothetical protein
MMHLVVVMDIMVEQLVLELVKLLPFYGITLVGEIIGEIHTKQLTLFIEEMFYIGDVTRPGINDMVKSEEFRVVK